MDVRESIFASIDGREFNAALVADGCGVLAGKQAAKTLFSGSGLYLSWRKEDGDVLGSGETILTARGSARQIALLEERLPGCLCKPSGIATAARQAVTLADGKIRVVSGAWKKMPSELKSMVRSAAEVGGIATRIVDGPFVYLDKNYVRMLGGIVETLEAVRQLPGAKVIQLRGEEASIEQETHRACAHQANVVMVDTGVRQDVLQALKVACEYPGVQVAFAGKVRLEEISELAILGVQILDIGAAIMDAPLLDMKLDVVRGDGLGI